MKILKIEFQNINSLKGPHQVDFSVPPFTASSLFAITGPTGSGKSTLLDVICLALFNQIPRLGKISKNEILNKGALLTRNQKEAYARVTYESKTGTYASYWSISTNRNNNLRDYEMQLFDLSTDKAMDLKKSDVPGKNEELIGLNYDQFIKSVLLAQGEFAQFLRARKDERGALLEKITGTGIYRQLGIQAFLKKKEVTAAIEKEQQEISLLNSQLLEKEARANLSTAVRESSLQSDELEKKVKSLEESLQLKKEIQEQLNGIKASREKKESAEQVLDHFQKEQGLQLKAHENLQKVGEDLRRWQLLRTARQELFKEIEILREREGANSNRMQHCLEEIRQFLKDPVAPNSIEKSLQNFSTRVMNLQKKRDDKISSYRALQKEFNSEVREVPYELNGNLKEAQSELGQMKARLQQEITLLKPALVDLHLEKPESEKNRLRTELEKARKAEQAVQKILLLKEELNRIIKEKEVIKPELSELPEKIKLEQVRKVSLKQKVQNLHLERENIQLRKSLESHRAHLEEGKPCPLCGSLDHPYAFDLPPQKDHLKEEIRSAEKLLDQKNTEVSSLQTRLEYHQRRLQELLNKEKETEIQLQSEKNQFEKEFQQKFTAEREFWSKKVELLDKKMQAMDSFELKNRRLQAIAAGLPLLSELDQVTKEGKEIKKNLDVLYSGENVHSDCHDFQNRWSGIQHEKKNLENRIHEVQEKQLLKSTELEKLEKSLLPEVEKIGCRDLPEALAQLLPEDKAAEFRKKKEELCAEIARNEAAVKTLESQLHNLQKRDNEKTTEDIRKELEKSQERYKELKTTCESLRRKLMNDQETRDRIKKIESELEDKKTHTRRWEILNQLIGDSNGKKFNDFAQDLSLTQLLKLANHRMKDLSDRYILDKPVDGEDDSLVAIDEHMGGQRRSVKTLSGGETFILSLSMALALSDLASKNVEINSLFIDEGFGTLDPETLDQTLDTLEKLQAETSKTIGIISHVDSLKERIATQIRLQRNGQGYSSLSISG